MRTAKMILTAFSALIFAAAGEFTASADMGAAAQTAVIQPYPGTEEAVRTMEAVQTAEAVQPTETVRTAEAVQPAEAAPELQPAPQLAPQPATGQQIADYASQFIGNPYVYGGTSLTNGADCSGFVMKVYEQFGVQLPRTSRAQGRAGADVGGIENAQPGDIVSYRGHIGIYRGQNQLVHASSPETGIKISPVNYKPILSVRRVV